MILNPKPYTLYPKSNTLNPIPKTPIHWTNPTPYTPHPTPYTLHPRFGHAAVVVRGDILIFGGARGSDRAPVDDLLAVNMVRQRMRAEGLGRRVERLELMVYCW